MALSRPFKDRLALPLSTHLSSGRTETSDRKRCRVAAWAKLQALVYDILPSTKAMLGVYVCMGTTVWIYMVVLQRTVNLRQGRDLRQTGSCCCHRHGTMAEFVAAVVHGTCLCIRGEAFK